MSLEKEVDARYVAVVMRVKNRFTVFSWIGGVAVAVFVVVALTDALKVPGETMSSTERTVSGHAVAGNLRPEQTAPRVKGDPKSLVVQRDELPGEFALVGGESKGAGEFAQLYFNPQALVASDDTNEGLLGVIVNLTLLDDLQAARARFVAQGGLDTSSVLQDVRSSTPGAVPREVTPYPMTVSGTDRVIAFQVHYVLQGTEVYEYRVRIIVGNALVNLIISARATTDGVQPATLERHARAIVDRQVARLTAARG